MATRNSGRRDKRDRRSARGGKSARGRNGAGGTKAIGGGKSTLGKKLGAGKPGKSGRPGKPGKPGKPGRDTGKRRDTEDVAGIPRAVETSGPEVEEKNTDAAHRSTPTSRGWAVLADLLGKRAGLRVLWELRGGPLKFRALQAACDGLSPSTLNQRLADLREARLVVIEERQGYRLTPQGEEFAGLLLPLAGWADGWAHRRAQKRRREGPPDRRTRGKLG